jgi:hypothetical protein
LNLTYIIETKFDETVISCKKNRGKQRTRIWQTDDTQQIKYL